MFADPSTAPNSLARQSPEQQQVGVVKQQQQDLLLSPPSNAASPSSSTRTNRQLYDDQQQQQQNQKASSPKNTSSNLANIQELQTNLIMQDRIIATLESDNSRLLSENKNLRTELKQAKEKANIAVALNHPNAQQQQQASSAIPPTPTTNISPETAITIASLKEDLAKQREEIDQERKDMARKISWYIDRQEVSAAQDALVSEQQAQIRDLRLQVADLEAQVMTLGGGRTASSSSPTAEKDKQIRVLHRRVAELEETIRNHSPDSLAELIRATRPPLTEAAEFKKMKAQLEEANARPEEQEQSAQRALSQLRVDSDNLRSQYAKRLEKVEEEMKLRIAATQTRKTKELEKSLGDTRRFYSQKVKDLEEQLAGYKRGDHINHQNRTSSSSSAVVNSPHFTLPTHQQTGTVSNKQQQHSSGRAASTSSNNNKKTNNKSNNQENNNNNNGTSSDENNNNNNSMMIMTPFGPMPMNQQNMNNLLGVNPQQQQQQQMMSMMNMNNNNHNQGNSQQQQMPLMIPVTDPSMQQKIWFLETRVKTLEEENRFLQKQASESVLSTGAAAAVQSQLGESQRENVTLQRLLRESQDQQRKTLHELEERLHHEKDIHAKEVERLNSQHREEMKALQTRCDAEIRLRSDSVTSRQLMAFSSGLSNVMGTDLGANASTKELRRYLLLLAERVHSLERQLAATESEHTRQLNELKRVSEFELEVEKQKMGIALKQKNAEIDGFKVQLDSMLDQISRLRK